ncbi:MAG: S8 family serine peptidase [bacterium]
MSLRFSPPPPLVLPLAVVFICCLLAVGLICPTACPAAMGDSARLAPPLQRALADSFFPGRQADGRYVVWVYFRDKGIDDAELPAALATAEARLDERALRRRTKTRHAGEALVGRMDLPVQPRYLEQVVTCGATLRRQSRWLNATSVLATREQIQQLAGLSCVQRLDLVGRHRPQPEELFSAQDQPKRISPRIPGARAGSRDDIDYGESLTGLAQINVPAVHAAGYDGTGVIIGLLDTGFSLTHRCLDQVPVLAQWDFVNDDGVVADEEGDPDGAHDHGTKVLSVLAGFADGELVGPAFGATVALAKTEDVADEIPAEEDNWVAGIEWLESIGVDLVSSSIGYDNWYGFPDLDGNTAACTIAGDLAVSLGVVVCNSAGNERYVTGHIIAPADGDSIIAVGAVRDDGDYAYFSSPGPTFDGRIKPDICALGFGNHVVSTSTDSTYTVSSGTSLSCPLAAGVAALLLSRAPELTPMQIREALRETADWAGYPDNDYGWGIIDALAALTYFGPSIEHEPLFDTEDTVGPYPVACRITDRVPLDPVGPLLRYRVNGGGWLEEPLSPAGVDSFVAFIPGQPAGSGIEYYLQASDSLDIELTLPADAVATLFTFAVLCDTAPPVIVSFPLGDQPLAGWPPTVQAQVTDNLGVAQVWVEWTYAGSEQTPFSLAPQTGDLYQAEFPSPSVPPAVGDTVGYRLLACDVAAMPNLSATNTVFFSLLDILGPLLVIDAEDSKYSISLATAAGTPHAKGEIESLHGKSAGSDLADWLVDAGYTVDLVPAVEVIAGSLDGYLAVVLSCGSSVTPVADADLRTIVEVYVAAGGKLLVEGGEVGYDAVAYPGYPSFAASVLHADHWLADDAGELQVQAGMTEHPLLQVPNLLPATIEIDYTGYGDLDALEPASDAYVVYGTSDYPAAGGILVYDNNVDPESAQIVFFAFNIDAVEDTDLASQLVENGMAFLLAAETTGYASVTGVVNLVDSTDNSGATVCFDTGPCEITGLDGVYLLENLAAGSHLLTVSRAGYETRSIPIELDDGEAISGIDCWLRPVTEHLFVDSVELPIPDDDPAGLVTTIEAFGAGPLAKDENSLSAISVDLYCSHSAIGDLIVELTSPAGTTVRLHDHSGGFANDLSGNYPTTLTVDGPGSLADFHDEAADGSWILFVADVGAGGSGVVHDWGLHLWVPDVVTAAGDPLPPDQPAMPTRTALLRNVPNPFNPRTTIRFDLTRAQQVKLEIYDLRGRLVRRLVAADWPAGRHHTIWDGRDENGRDVGSGSYLCRFRAGNVRQEQKLLLLR